jgi:2-oxoisovalerate dehydrogenase E1 component alpha subunit
LSSRKPGLGKGLEALIPAASQTTTDTSIRETPIHGVNDMFQLIEPDGSVRDRLPLTLEEMRRLYADMVEARIFDRKSIALQRQGRLATYAPFEGQEAAQIGAAAALKPQDWVAATYRDAALNWRAGYPWRLLILGRTGDERGGEVPEGINILPPSITVGGHMIHAVGLAWAEKLKGSDSVAFTSFGDGATSEGDFHEAMNFAAVYETPTVFFCQNNGFAISYPTHEQTRSETIAAKAEAYGMPGARVDGNDIAAVLAVVREAIERARSGRGPSLIEAVTYRLGPHTTSDDPGRYREESSTEQWRERDPLLRIRRLLDKAQGWSEEWEEELQESAAQRIEEAVEWAESLPPPAREDLFERMFQSPTASLQEQRKEASDG